MRGLWSVVLILLGSSSVSGKQQTAAPLEGNRRKQATHAAVLSATGEVSSVKIKNTKAHLVRQPEKANPTISAERISGSLAATAAHNQVSDPTVRTPAAGAEHLLLNKEKFDQEFTIDFKVKFDAFNHPQALVTTAPLSKALWIEATPSADNQSATIKAWIKTEKGTGPTVESDQSGHGVAGFNGRGYLESTTMLSTGQWYEVKFQKTPGELSLKVGDEAPVKSQVDGAKVHSGNDFDLAQGNTKLLVGLKAGSGDRGLEGEMGDVCWTEGNVATGGVHTCASVPVAQPA